MRILFLTTYYPGALRAVYERTPGLADQTYADQLSAIYSLGFARSDFLIRNLRDLGHEAEQVIVNALPAQEAWGRANGIAPPAPLSRLLNSAVRSAGYRLRRFLSRPNPTVTDLHCERLVHAQVEAFKPEIVFLTDVLLFRAAFLSWLARGRTLVGECGYPIPEATNLRPFHLLLSAASQFVASFRRAGHHAELWRHAFETRALERVGDAPLTQDVVFVGLLSGAHSRRLALLEAVSGAVPLSCHAPREGLPPHSMLTRRVRPPVWGFEMLRLLRGARIALNNHIDAAATDAGNGRLYEATGVGTLLVTDSKPNLSELFDVGREIVAYSSAEECVEQLRHYLKHEDERRAIAEAGQRRTLREHTYRRRAEELVGMLSS